MPADSDANAASLREAKHLRFSTVAFDPRAPQSQPSILLVTQNVGGIESVGTAEEEEIGSPSTVNNRSFFSVASRMTLHEDGHDLDEDLGVSEEIKMQTWEFLADLRAWLHQAAFAAADGARLPARRPSSSDRAPGEAAIRRGRRGPPTGADDSSTATPAAYSIAATPPQLDVIVLHFQEIGGKYANAAFTSFFAEQVRQHLLPEAGWCSGVLTDSPGASNQFTAIGTVVFVSPRLCPLTSVLVLPHRTYIPVMDDPASYGGASTRTFHSAKFSNAGSSRKGFVFTSVRIGSTLLHCCNVHLFNDVSNCVSLEASPSVYVKRRTEALLEAAAECLTIAGKDDPIFFFGDMNLRLDGKALAAYAKSTLHADLVAETKALRAPDTFWALFADAHRTQEVLEAQFDLEPRQLMDRIAQETTMELAEMPVRFSPTYLRLPEPYVARWTAEGARVSSRADPHGPLPSLVAAHAGRPYAHARLPAWCDRIFFNPAGLELVAGGAGRPSAPGEAETNGTSAASPTNHYLYDALHLCHTDHDGVFLLF